MQRSTRFNRPTLRGSSVASVLFGRADMFTLSAAPASTTAVDLTWSASPSSPDNYRVERSLNGISFTTVTTVGNTTFTYQDTGRTESVQYWYRIVPILGGSDQEASNIADTWTVPATPTGLTATAISSTQINLAWTDVSTGNTAQSIQRRSPAGSGSYSFIASVGATATSYSDTGLTLATQYEYQVAATNPAAQSAWSTAANATTTGGGPPSPNWTLDFSSGEPWSNGTNYTFSSTASTSRTYVDSSGYIAPCVANLCLHSSRIDNAYWVGTNATKANVSTPTAPDNSTDTCRVLETTATGFHVVDRNFVTTSTGRITVSAYVKKDTRRYVGIYGFTAAGGNTYRVIFDLDNNAAFSAENPAGTPAGTYGSVSAGNGWYRIWISMVTGNATHYPGIFLSDRSDFSGTLSSGLPSYAGSTSEGVYVWGLQVVEGGAPLPYSATTTSTNGIPRLTHNSSGSRLGLLVEEQRTNLIQGSGTVGGAGGWAQSNLSLGTTTTAPDNTNTGRRFVENTLTNAPHHTYHAGTVGDCTVSIYAKKDQREHLTVSIFVAVNNYAAATFDLANGTAGSIVYGTAPTQTVSSATARIENAGNGWYRCIVSGNKASGSTYLVAATATQASPSLDQYASELYTGSTSNGLFLWGGQMEERTSVSSYIPTTTASVTRSADLVHVLKNLIIDWQDPGAVVVHFYKPGAAGNVIFSTENAANQQLGIEETSAGGKYQAFWSSGNTADDTGTSGVQKAVHYWNGTNSRFCLNGGTVNAATNNITTFGNIDFLTLAATATDSAGVPGTWSRHSNAIIRKVEFYKGPLTDPNLQAITT